MSENVVQPGIEPGSPKEMSENVVQPGIEPGSPDYRSDALTTRPLNQPRMLRVSFSLISLVVLISDLPHLTVICITFSEIPGESPLQMENRGVILSEMRQSVAHNPFLPPY